MTINLHQASVPVFVQQLNSMKAVLAKAEAYAAARKIQPEVLVNARLFPDMLPLVKQVQIASDFAKGCTARLAGREVPKWEDTEKTFAELQARLDKAIEFVKSVPAEEIIGQEAREVSLPVGGQTMTFQGLPYLTGFVLPNFFFHATTAYAILRHNGVEIGKRDFIGQP
ncbi:MAG: hypothetical protein RJB26_1838 [Pseudomonadota bacterium]|jgi:hypothetical protein